MQHNSNMLTIELIHWLSVVVFVAMIPVRIITTKTAADSQRVKHSITVDLIIIDTGSL